MKYCADTWFILETFAQHQQAVALFREVREGKAHLVIPVVVYAESIKKLFQKGISQQVVQQFFETVEASDKVELVIIDKAIAQEAAKLSLSFRVPLIDAFVAATGKLTGCEVLLSGDQDYHLLAKKKYLRQVRW